MREEVAAAVVFLTRIVKKNQNLSPEQCRQFSDHLSTRLVEKFRNHWHGENPTKGQAYRCIRINESEPVDPILERVASDTGVTYSDLGLPLELTLWCDPQEVTVRLGENKGAVCTVANFKDGNNENKAQTLDLDVILRHSEELRNTFNYKIQLLASSRKNDPSNRYNRLSNQAYHSTRNAHHNNNQYQWHQGSNQYNMPGNQGDFSSHIPTKKHSNRYSQGNYFNPQRSDMDHSRWVRGADLIKGQ